MASRLEKLAPELLVAIATCIDERVDVTADTKDNSTKQDLYALCLTSRTLQAATTPFLYKRFFPDRSSEQFWQFARTLTASPELMKYVQCLTVSPCNADEKLQLNREEVDRLSLALSPLKGTSIYDALVRACEAGCSTAFAMAIVCLASSVKSLAIVQNTDGHFGLWEQALPVDDPCRMCSDIDAWLAQLFDHSWMRRYPNLKALTLAGRPRNSTELKLVRLAIQMSGMNTICCVNFGVGHGSDTWQLVSASISSHRALSLKRSWLIAADLIELITARKDLSSLEIEWDDPYPNDDEDGSNTPPTVDIALVANAIRSHANTLGNLILRVMAWDESIRGTVGVALLPLTALKILEIDQKILIGETLWCHAELHLPPTLLLLTINSEDIIHELPYLLEVIGSAACRDLWQLTVNFAAWQGIHPDERWISWLPGMINYDSDEQLQRYGNTRSWDLRFSVKDDHDWDHITFEASGPKLLEFCSSYGEAIDSKVEDMREAALKLRAEEMHRQGGGE
ncbi:hypothetical protein LTR56_023748 [Elasticomyces elasticus]|nr:hypothetical protein LTR56_023748 [Elasticomyces elasticus]KAK3662382.1 hypothetical protein LTR22_006915 [Elasticomyces elasticus]KAK4912453.1 hypothetical protein LTR49_019067 [Elasticomyces elasticus]KAK5766915.1 hypothetical protein LTS12_002991 [Elasticomyces elasticus]